MPVFVNMDVVRMSQEEFGEIAFRVMREAFALHGELGRLLDEQVYQHALAARVGDLQREVRIDVCFRDFRKQYFMDAVVAEGAVFELKAVDALALCHRNQLLNYLLLCGLEHGKLVNFRTERVQHEFVNTSLSLAERRKFQIDDAEWHPTYGFGDSEKDIIIELLRDWGTGLERPLYEEALIHLLGGKEELIREVDIVFGRNRIAHQTVALCAPQTAIRVTAFEDDDTGFARHLMRFLNAARLDTAQWINISRHQLTLKTLHFSA